MQADPSSAARGDFDLSRHQEFSGTSMEYFDEEAKAKYVPHVIEPSAGVDRLALALICNAYCEDEAPDEKGKLETRVVMRFHPRIAPIKVAVFPLLKKKPELVKKAKEVRELLRPHMSVFYDEAGAIGRRYRRQDEAGTPFGVTVDFQTLEDRTVTVRDRAAKDITSFVFRQADNPALAADVSGTVGASTVTLALPYGSTLPATAKSKILQSTSSLNCMAIKGTSKINATASAMRSMFLLCIRIGVSLFFMGGLYHCLSSLTSSAKRVEYTHLGRWRNWQTQRT